MGLLKLNKPGSGIAQFDAVALAFELLAEAQSLGIAGSGLEQYFARFAITGFHRVDDALVQLGRDRDAVDQAEQRLLEIDIEKRFRRRKLEVCPFWKSRLKPFLRRSKRWSRKASVVPADRTGNNAYQRDPCGCASIRFAT